eukprot:scaffold495_cov19-Tisochrysis_lutea.AAC.1
MLPCPFLSNDHSPNKLTVGGLGCRSPQQPCQKWRAMPCSHPRTRHHRQQAHAQVSCAAAAAAAAAAGWPGIGPQKAGSPGGNCWEDPAPAAGHGVARWPGHPAAHAAPMHSSAGENHEVPQHRHPGPARHTAYSAAV